MIIKHSYDDNALKDLNRVLSVIENKFRRCIYWRHDVFDILYVSSLIISPYIRYNGIRLLNRIKNICNEDPSKFICLIRTTAPSYFPGGRGKYNRTSMRILQQKAVDYLRDKCYVIVYDPSKPVCAFLNHAKFVIYYHICSTEKTIYHMKYYGSTNFTVSGLAYIWDFKGRGKIGNYEEYVVTQHIKSGLNKNDIFYLKELRELIKYKSTLYTDPNYLRKYLTTHLRHLEYILHYSKQAISGTPLGLLLKTYLKLSITYSQSLALLDEIPGKRITRKIQDKLFEILEPMDPFVIEMITPTIMEETEDQHIEEFEIIARELELKDRELREKILEFIRVIETIYELLGREYLRHIPYIKDYFDDKEKDFYDIVKSYSYKYVEKIESLIRTYSRRS